MVLNVIALQGGTSNSGANFFLKDAQLLRGASCYAHTTRAPVK
jgi:hypothetical protein